ncbi:MAG: Hydroxypyruvate isomerase (EC [uncultured Caballeronia sp.]|nr:MAG: Hydroxypyruvate isomerase (EC [uncultured Caballeronia sp.]
MGITILIEPINTHDMPSFFLNRQDHAQAIFAAAGTSNLKVQSISTTARSSKAT